MPEQKLPPRQLILEAVLTCIEKYGIDKLTTRKIAEAAGTNVASINYYFRTKDALVEEALAMALNHMLQDVNAAIEERERPFPEILEDVLFYWIDGNTRFPGITAAHLYSAVFDRQTDSPGARAINAILEKLNARAAEEYSAKLADRSAFLLSQILSATLFNLLAPDFFSHSVPARTGRDLARSYRELFTQTMASKV